MMTDDYTRDLSSAKQPETVWCEAAIQEIDGAVMGQSQHMQRTPKSIDVRFTPKATVSCENAVRRFGPASNIRHRKISEASSVVRFPKPPSSTAVAASTTVRSGGQPPQPPLQTGLGA